MIIRWSKLRNIAEIEKHFGMINVDDCDFYYGLEFEIIRCTSEIQRKFLIFFVFRSVCTTFDAVRLRYSRSEKPKFIWFFSHLIVPLQ